MERTDQPNPQPSPAQPQPNQILAQPATVQACAEDYVAGADVRQAMNRQDSRR
ncbi:hypothetical protein [Streptomyces sp. NPDC013455]|uniref:hypothetical protein n=1 Tax=Streptomyces sp. NPDC013455 TaxID=3155605 RepID=UPI0033D3B7F5